MYSGTLPQIQTVGGEIRRTKGPIYKCQIRDLVGRVRHFFAFRLKEITGKMFCPLSGEQLTQLFPESPGVERLAVKQRVDFIIGLEHPSW